MLRRHALFDGLAAQFAAATLVGIETSGPIRRVLDGEAWIDL